MNCTQSPINTVDRTTLNEWINHPARKIYQRFLHAQEAEKKVDAINLMATGNDADKQEAVDLLDAARVLRAAAEFLNQLTEKDRPVYDVEIKPQPTT